MDQRFGSAAQPTADEVLRYYREHPAEFTRAGRLAPFTEVQPAIQQTLAAIAGGYWLPNGWTDSGAGAGFGSSVSRYRSAR